MSKYSPYCGHVVNNPKHYRGLCRTCYIRWSNRVHRGVTTWDKLQADGVCGAKGEDTKDNNTSSKEIS